MALEEENLRLTNTDHNHHQTSTFKSYLLMKKFVDVTLTCTDGVSFKAHRMVLSASSPFFYKILSDVHESPLVVIMPHDISSGALLSCIEFIYSGEVIIKESRLDEFIRAAEILRVKGLIEADESSASNGAVVEPRPAKLTARMSVQGKPLKRLGPSQQSAVSTRRSSAVRTQNKETLPEDTGEDEPASPSKFLDTPRSQFHVYERDNGFEVDESYALAAAD